MLVFVVRCLKFVVFLRRSGGDVCRGALCCDSMHAMLRACGGVVRTRAHALLVVAFVRLCHGRFVLFVCLVSGRLSVFCPFLRPSSPCSFSPLPSRGCHNVVVVFVFSMFNSLSPFSFLSSFPVSLFVLLFYLVVLYPRLLYAWLC